MRKRLLYTCLCGKHFIGRPNGKGSDIYCLECSSSGKEPTEAIEPSFLLTNEISKGNFNIRLKEGFELLGID